MRSRISWQSERRIFDPFNGFGGFFEGLDVFDYLLDRRRFGTVFPLKPVNEDKFVAVELLMTFRPVAEKPLICAFHKSL